MASIGCRADNDAEDGTLEMDEDGRLKVARPKISGKIKLTYDAETERERALEVDADAYMTELRGQVKKLCNDLQLWHTNMSCPMIPEAI